jgi:hypothetical protein
MEIAIETTNYLTIKSVGFTAYCNALIARRSSTNNNILHACLLSLIGTPSHIKSLSALILTGGNSGGYIKVSGDDLDTTLRFSGTAQTCRSRKIGETVNKVLTMQYFSKTNLHAAAVFGPDLPTVQERAFRRLDMATTIPLKPQWQEWLWETMLHPEKLYSFGGEDLQEAYLVIIPDDETLESKVLKAIRNGQIQ